jgi:hypothetical protein
LWLPRSGSVQNPTLKAKRKEGWQEKSSLFAEGNQILKAILIDPTKREIKGIEIDPSKAPLTSAFGNKKILLLTTAVNPRLMLCYNGNADPPSFWFINKYIIVGKALLVGRENGNWPAPIALNVKDIECLVRFAS